MTKTVTTKTITKYRYELYHDDILAFDWSSVPEDAEIYMNVPGGGDWSHMELNTTHEPMIVKWSETDESFSD